MMRFCWSLPVLLCFLAGVAHAVLIDVGDRAPDFAISLPGGKTTSLIELLKEGPVLVRFAATGCTVCTAEFPYVEKMQAAYTKKNFRIINVMNDSQETVNAVIKEKKPATLFVSDPNKTIRSKYGVPRVPKSFLVDKDGEVAAITVQFSSESLNQMSTQVAALVKIPPQVIATEKITPCVG